MNFCHKYYPSDNNASLAGEHCAVLLGWNNNSNDMLNALQKKNIAVVIIYSLNKFSAELGKNNYQNEEVDRVSESLVNYLNGGVKFAKKLVIISSDDMYTVLLAFSKVDLNERFIYQNHDQDLVTKCANKVEFSLLCQQHSIDSPLTFVITDLQHLTKIKSKLIFPGIVKPQYPGAVPKKIIPKVLKINNIEELEALGKKLWTISIPLFYQELVPGGSENIFFIGGYFSQKENEDLLFIGKKRLEMPVLGGSTTYATLQWNSSVFNAAKKIVEAINYQGLADIEFKYDERDGKYKIIEVNPRIGRWHLISSIKDWDIISAYFFKLSNQHIPSINLHTEGQSWISPHLSLCGFIEKKGILIGLCSWLIALKKSNVIVDLNIRDLSKTLHQIRVVLGHIKAIGLKKTLLGD